MKKQRSTLSAIISSAVCAAPLAALTTGSPTASAVQENLGDMEEVIVVASTRTGNDLSSTAAAVTALSANSLINAGITDATYLGERTPNVTINRANGLQITIRGVSSTDNTEKGDPSAAFLLDGVYIARAQAMEVSFFDLEQVEVLRGPQGTLYGRNATAGLINVISAKPKLGEFNGWVDTTVGDYGKVQSTGAVNLPISDSAAVRAAVNMDRRDSFLENHPDSNADIQRAKDNLSFRLSGLFELGDAANLLVQADHTSLQGSNRADAALSNFYDLDTMQPPNGEAAGTNPRYIADSKSTDELLQAGYAENGSADYDNSTLGLATELNWNLSDQVTLTYLGSYREFERRESYTGYSGTVAAIDLDVTGPRLFNGDYSQQSHELRVTYDNEWLNLQGGVYNFSEESGIEFLLLGLGGLQPGDDNYVFGFPQDPTKADSLAFFTQGTVDVTDTLRATAGIRFTDDEKSRRGAAIHHRNLGEEQNFVFDEVTNPIPDSLNNARVEYQETTWKLGLDYDLTEDILLYGIVSTGYKAGGFNDGCLETDSNCASPVPEAALFYDPETLTAYEIGVKFDLANGLRSFITAFDYDYKNLQLSNVSEICGGPCQITSNAGQASVTGLEFENRWIINNRNRLTLDLTFLDAEYTDYPITESANLSGLPLNRSPEMTFNLGYEHIWPLNNGGEVVVNGNYRWSDEYYILSSGLRAQFEQPSYSRSDLTLTYNSPENQWTLQGFVRNIEDEITVGSANPVPAFPALADGSVQISDPRTMGLRFRFNF